jgi:hypothetical protein
MTAEKPSFFLFENTVGSKLLKRYYQEEIDRKAFMIGRVLHELNFSMDFALIIKGFRAKAMEKFSSHRTR